MRIGCCTYRLESTLEIVFDGLGVKRTMVLARALVTPYWMSREALDRLDEMDRTVILPNVLNVYQDVET